MKSGQVHPPPLDDGNLRAQIWVGGTASAVTSVYTITIKGQSPWRTLTGTVFSDDSIHAGAIAQFAGFNNVQFDLLGTLVKDNAGAIIGYDALLTVGGRGELPGGQPIVYRIVARP